jgi:hypothetical protein
MNEKAESLRVAKKLQWAFAPYLGPESYIWKAVRRQLYITGSKAGDAIGVGYGSRRAYWKKKVKELARGATIKEVFHPQVQSRLDHGQRWENTALYLIKLHLQMRLLTVGIRQVEVLRTGIVLSPEDSRIGATPDAYLPSQNAVIEIKCRYPNAEPDSATNEPYSTPNIPPSHLIQMMLEMHCTGARRAIYGCLCLPYATTQCEVWRLEKQAVPFKLSVEVFHWNEELWRDFIKPRLEFFMESVETKVQPKNVYKKAALVEYIRAKMKPFSFWNYRGTTRLLRQPVGNVYPA